MIVALVVCAAAAQTHGDDAAKTIADRRDQARRAGRFRQGSAAAVEEALRRVPQLDHARRRPEPRNPQAMLKGGDTAPASSRARESKACSWIARPARRAAHATSRQQGQRTATFRRRVGPAQVVDRSRGHRLDLKSPKPSTGNRSRRGESDLCRNDYAGRAVRRLRPRIRSLSTMPRRVDSSAD